MWYSLARRAAKSSLLLAVAWLSPAMAEAVDDRPPPDMLLEMVDPSLCMVPPAEMADDEIIAMMGSADPEMAPSVSGTLNHVSEWQAVGHGHFNTGANGLVASLELVLRDDADRLRFLCMALVRHIDTHMTQGEASLIGPGADTVEGETFMVVALVGERVDGEFEPLGELLTESGVLSLERLDEETLAGSLALSGELDGLEETSAPASLDLELRALWEHPPMRVVDWDKADVTAASSSVGASDEAFAELRALFIDDLQIEFSPTLAAEESDIVQHTLYRYDYETFASLQDEPSMQRGREHFLYRHDDQLYPFFRPSSARSMPFFDELVDPGFRLNDETAGEFRELLVALSGERFFETVEIDDIQQRGDEWAFITGTFFSDYKAYVVSVDDEGQVKGVSYDLTYLPKE